MFPDFFSVVFELILKVIDFGDEFIFLVIAESLVLLFEKHFFFLLKHGYFLVVFLLHFRDKFVLHVDLFLCHLFKVVFLLLDVFLNLMKFV